MLNNPLLLLSGNDIPFIQAQIAIHQPTIKEISYIGEQSFYIGCSFLNFSKEKLDEQDKNNLESLTDFEVLMSILKNDNAVVKRNRVCMQLVLLLIFPQYTINFLPMSIMLSRKTQQDGVERHLIDKDNFNVFKDIISQMFCLNQATKSTQKYNPGGPQAKALVQKFKKRQKKLAELKGKGHQNQTISILSKYVSILTVGEKKDMNSLLQYTVYQLFDEFQRFKLKQNFDMYVSATMAGAQDLEEIQNWMSDIHSNTL